MIVHTNIQALADLRKRRLAMGLSQERLSRLADCSLHYVQLLEGGFTPRRSRVLPQILAALEKAEGGLVGENEDDRALHDSRPR